jgi:hypothetical protein
LEPVKKKVAFLVIAIALAAFTIAGAPYYLQGMAGRVRSPLHPWFRSSGYLGQSAGILAFLGFAFLWLYPIRKRVKRLAVTGSIPRWLDVHITVGLFLPWLVGLHAGWRFGGLAGLAFVAMVVVWASGIVGRYLYARIPRSRNGLELSREEITAHRRELVLKIAAVTAWQPQDVERMTSGALGGSEGSGTRGALLGMIADDVARRRAIHNLERRWRRLDPEGGVVDQETRREVLRLARQEMSLAQQVRMLDATRRIFRYWHVAHLPVGLTALLAVCVHVVVVIVLGTTWFK